MHQLYSDKYHMFYTNKTVPSLELVVIILNQEQCQNTISALNNAASTLASKALPRNFKQPVVTLLNPCILKTNRFCIDIEYSASDRSWAQPCPIVVIHCTSAPYNMFSLEFLLKSYRSLAVSSIKFNRHENKKHRRSINYSFLQGVNINDNK